MREEKGTMVTKQLKKHNIQINKMKGNQMIFVNILKHTSEHIRGYQFSRI